MKMLKNLNGIEVNDISNSSSGEEEKYKVSQLSMYWLRFISLYAKYLISNENPTL